MDLTECQVGRGAAAAKRRRPWRVAPTFLAMRDLYRGRLRPDIRVIAKDISRECFIRFHASEAELQHRIRPLRTTQP